MDQTHFKMTMSVNKLFGYIVSFIGKYSITKLKQIDLKCRRGIIKHVNQF